MPSYDYGTTDEPGIVTDLTSASQTPTFGEAPNNLCLVGHGDLDEATNAADPDQGYLISRATSAVEWFGPPESSRLTEAVFDAMTEGAYPVYAVVADETEQTVDLSSETSPTVSPSVGHIREQPSGINITYDGSGVSDENITVTFKDVSEFSPSGSEVVVNPVNGEFRFPNSPDSVAGSTSITVDEFDYTGAIDTAQAELAGDIDFLVPLSERQTVADKANTTVEEMEQKYNLAMAFVGTDSYIDDVNNYTQSYDDSRTQIIYPTRFEDGSSALAAYAGHKAQLGLEDTPINNRFENNASLNHTLDVGQRGTLIDEDVVPLADESRGVRIADDVTTATNQNADGRNLEFGFNRLAADYIIQITRRNEEPFIGLLQRPGVRQVLQRLVNQQLTELEQSNIVLDHEVTVLSEGPTTVSVEMNLDLVEPLRFIENSVVIESGRAGTA